MSLDGFIAPGSLGDLMGQQWMELLLARAGLVVRGHRAQYRPCAIDAAPLQDVSNWTEQYRPIWESRFDRMNDYLTQLGRQQEARKQDG